MENRWIELTVVASVELSEIVIAHLSDIAPQGVSVEPVVIRDDSSMGYQLDMASPQSLRVWLPAAERSAVLIENLREKLGNLPIEISVRPIQEEDWKVSWREFFGPILIGRIAIVPSWVNFENEQNKIVIRIDPGQAFGTGHHETTRLCLDALSRYVISGQHVLDVGTGSGILSIAAVHLGASSVDAWDIDLAAVNIARANCVKNAVSQEVSVHEGNFKSTNRRYDLAIANISANTVGKLVPLFASVAPKSDARLLLSGFLEKDAQQIEAAAFSVGFEKFERYVENDWALISASR